jgi:hypothetical protein
MFLPVPLLLDMSMIFSSFLALFKNHLFNVFIINITRYAASYLTLHDINMSICENNLPYVENY